jgi:hypothetical protein
MIRFYRTAFLAVCLCLLAPLAQAKTFTTTITRPANTTAYAANDGMADATALTGGSTILDACRGPGSHGFISDVEISSSNDPATTLQGEIQIFDTAVTAVDDNSAFAVSDAEAQTRVARISFTLVDNGNNQAVTVPNLALGYSCAATANLRFLIKVINAYTPASAEQLTIRFKFFPLND